MAVRDDIYVEWFLSPRIVVVEAPSTNVTIQDLHDTLRVLEQRLENLVYPHLVATAGKEDLGGGTSVGLTMTMQNARLSFAARKSSTSTGTVSTADTTGITLTDASATFLTDGIEPGASIVNHTDLSRCSVRRVLSETQLYTDRLGGGADNQFETGDVYTVQNVTQCSVDGGNLVAVDDVGDPLGPILPTAGTQVSRTSSSSATLQELADIRFGSFDGAVHIDPTSSFSGTDFPTGTPRQKVNNFVDALEIAKRGLDTLRVHGSMTVNSGLDFRGFRFEGQGRGSTVLTIDDAALVAGCSFEFLTLQGTLDGETSIDNCAINDIVYVNGVIKNCAMRGEITLNGSTDASIINCWDDIAGFGLPSINFGGSGSGLLVRGYRGGLNLLNKTGTEDISIDMDSARVILEPSFGGTGDVIIRGVGHVTNNGTATSVDTSNVVNPETIMNTVWDESVYNHVTPGSFGKAIGRTRIR